MVYMPAYCAFEGHFGYVHVALALRYCPGWMGPTFYVLAWYAAIQFMIVFIPGAILETQGNPLGESLSDAELRSMLGISMIFYAITFIEMYAVFRTEKSELPRYCSQGHEMAPYAEMCEECGEKIALEDAVKPRRE